MAGADGKEDDAPGPKGQRQEGHADANDEEEDNASGPTTTRTCRIRQGVNMRASATAKERRREDNWPSEDLLVVCFGELK